VIYCTWPFKVRADAQFLACFVVGVFLFLLIFLLDLAFGWSSGNGRVGYEATSTGTSPQKSLFGKMTTRCGKRKPAFSRARISVFMKSVPSFTGEMFGTFGPDLTHFHLEPFTHHSISSLRKKSGMRSSLFFL
jgi:hypothetical protein